MPHDPTLDPSTSHAPARGRIEVRIAGVGVAVVPVGTPALELLPREVAGSPVVSALLDQRPVSLATPIVASAALAPLTTAHWEGERVYRRSLGLAFLEACRRVEPSLSIRLGASLGFGQIIEVLSDPVADADAFARRTREALQELVKADVAFREEWWTAEQASAHFSERGQPDVTSLLRLWREASVQLIACGDVYALAVGPVVPSTRWLERFSVAAHEGDLFLVYGDRRSDSSRPLPTRQMVSASVGPKRTTDMAGQHRRWLRSLGVTSLGTLNQRAISAGVTDLVAVSEGFHERRVGQIAGEVASRREPVRLITIAGPSSSGKSTFIRRLLVQLQVEGIAAETLSLDDYYRDRDKCAKDASGQYDFEAFDALDLPLLHGHLVQLLEGRPVRTAAYDFTSGKSAPHGGREIGVSPGGVLLVEGIHGLNPALVSSLLPETSIFRVFVNPSTTMPLDALSHINISDIRLLRRIIRDRRARATPPADNIARWPSVRRGERKHIFPHIGLADAVFDSSLVYEPGVLKVFAERYLLEISDRDESYPTAYRLRTMLDGFVAIYPEQVPPNSLLREFIGGSSFDKK